MDAAETARTIKEGSQPATRSVPEEGTAKRGNHGGKLVVIQASAVGRNQERTADSRKGGTDPRWGEGPPDSARGTK